MPRPLANVSVLIAGAGLAGLTAARDLSGKGAAVTVIDARTRVGGRVLTQREPFLARQHAEAGADLIDDGQTAICTLIGELGLRRAQILRDGFTSIRQVGRGRSVRGRRVWYELARKLEPEIRTFCLGERRWDGGIAQAIGRESVAAWLDRIRAPKALRSAATAMRGFFLADPEDLSLLALVDQFAEEGPPGGEKTFRVHGGNDQIAATIARRLGDRVQLQTVLRAVRQSATGVTASLDTGSGLHQREFDYLICAMPASTLRDVPFDPAMPDVQREAIANLKYGLATKTALQFDRTPWRTRGQPRAFGTNLPVGAVWDGNEEQRGARGILTLMAGGGASTATQELLAAGGPDALVKQMSWMNLKKATLLASDSLSWEHEPWSRGGYAFFDHRYDPAIREWLARPFGRVLFAGEHTSMKWQGYMNGAVESGQRAAAELLSQHRDHKDTE